MLLLASARISRKDFSGDSWPKVSIKSKIRAAYFNTWTVSMPEISVKNQPQLVYISMALRWISKRVRAFTCSISDSSLPACLSRNFLRGADGSNISSI